MKQGMGKSMSSGGKTEPTPRAVSPGAVSRMGIHDVRTAAPPPLFEGRGLKAPMMGQTNHPKGSQGKF